MSKLSRYQAEMEDREADRYRARYLKQNLHRLSSLPTIFTMLRSQNDLPLLELALPNLTIFRHGKEKDCVLVATAFNLYLLKTHFSQLYSLFGASKQTQFQQAEIRPYCRWSLNAVEITIDRRDEYNVVISMLEYPVDDEGEAVYVDPSDQDELKRMGEGFCLFDRTSGLYSSDDEDEESDDDSSFSDSSSSSSSSSDDDDDDEKDKERKAAKKKKKQQREKEREEAKKLKEQKALEEKSEERMKEKAKLAWKTVVLTAKSPEAADLVVEELTKLSLTSIVLRQKWSRRRLKKEFLQQQQQQQASPSSSSSASPLANPDDAYEYVSVSSGSNKSGESDLDSNVDGEGGEDNNNNNKQEASSLFSPKEQVDDDDDDDDDDNSAARKRKQMSLVKLSPEEQKRRKKEANRRRNKSAREFQAQQRQLLLESQVITADTLRLNAEMRKVSALMSAEGAMDARLLKEIMESRLAVQEQREEEEERIRTQRSKGISTTSSSGGGEGGGGQLPDPVELLRQHVHDNEIVMEEVFSHHYEKFLTFVDKTAQLATETVEYVQDAHDSVGSSIDRCSTDLRLSAGSVLESRQVLSRVGVASDLLRKRVTVSRLLESAESCVSQKNVVGLAELLTPLATVTKSCLPATDTLAVYVSQIRLPQLKHIALDFATTKLHSWLASLRDCILPLGQELWRKSVDNLVSSSNNNDDNNNDALAVMRRRKKHFLNRMSERVEHVRKRIITTDPKKRNGPHGWRLEQTALPVHLEDVSVLFGDDGDENENEAQIVHNHHHYHRDPIPSCSPLNPAATAATSQKQSLAEKLAAHQVKRQSQKQKPESNNTSSPSSSSSSPRQNNNINNDDNKFSEGDYRGAAYGRTLRQLFKLCENEQQLLTTCMETRKLHLATLLQSFAPLSTTSSSTSSSSSATATASSSAPSSSSSLANSSSSSSSTLALPADFYSSKSFAVDCTRALGFLHCEELLVHEADIDFTTTHLLYVWSEIQRGIAERATAIGRKNPPSCAALFRILTHFRTAALGCLLIPLPEHCDAIDRVRREQRDNMQSVMFAQITSTLELLVSMDELSPEFVGDSNQWKNKVLQYGLHLGGANQIPLEKHSANFSSSSSSSNNNKGSISSSLQSRFHRNRQHGSASTGATGASTATTGATLSSLSSRLNQQQQQQNSSSSSSNETSLSSSPFHVPFSGIIPATGSAILGFLNECFSLGYDSGLDGGAIGANSDEAEENQGNRVVDPETGSMIEIVDGSCQREWADSTTVAMTELILRKLSAEFGTVKSKLFSSISSASSASSQFSVEILVEGNNNNNNNEIVKAFKQLAMVRNNCVAARLLSTCVEQRYALLFHGSVSSGGGVFEVGHPVFLSKAGKELQSQQDDIEQSFVNLLLDLITQRLKPLAKLSYWQELMRRTIEDMKKSSPSSPPTTTTVTSASSSSNTNATSASRTSATRTSSTAVPSVIEATLTTETRSPNTTRLKHLPSFASDHSVLHRLVRQDLFELFEFLLCYSASSPSSSFSSSSSSSSSASSARKSQLWPEALVCAQARSSVIRVADCITAYLETLITKCDIRKADDMLYLLPFMSSVVQDAVEEMMSKFNDELPWPDQQHQQELQRERSISSNSAMRASSTTSAASSSSSSSSLPPHSSTASLHARLSGASAGVTSSSSVSATSASSSSLFHQQQQKHQQQQVIQFPIDNLDDYFSKKIKPILEQHALEYRQVAAKIGANLDIAANVALRGANAAFDGVKSVGRFATDGLQKVGGTVFSGAKRGVGFVTNVATSVGDEVVDQVKRLKEEAEES